VDGFTHGPTDHARQFVETDLLEDHNFAMMVIQKVKMAARRPV
jgi:hypothetical protein